MNNSSEHRNYYNICLIPTSSILKKNESEQCSSKSVVVRTEQCGNLHTLEPEQLFWLVGVRRYFASYYRQSFLCGRPQTCWNTYVPSINFECLSESAVHVEGRRNTLDNTMNLNNNDITGETRNHNDNIENEDDNNIINRNNNEDIEEENNRDWLDNFYIISRIFILFGIVYFYSSPMRFFVVTLLGFLIYLYHKGLLRFNAPMAQNHDHQINMNEADQRNENLANTIHQPVQNERIDGNMHREATDPGYNNGREMPRLLPFIWTFITSFFTSLIPDQPNAV